MNIGDIFFAFRGSSQQLEADAKKAGDKAGATAAKSFGQRFAQTVKVGGAAIVGGFAAGLTAGVVQRFAQLERAQQEFQRETGATAEEAQKAGQAINDMASRNLQPIEEIGRVLAGVTTDWGLHGEAAAKAADQVLKYARATGQDARGAVTALDDVMDSWNLDSSRSVEIMDKLIVSHQKYGGNIEQNQVSLAQLAPAMQAANFQIDDAIGLLGLFGSKGLDANQGAAAFAKALTKVKSPQELQDLITDISDTTNKFDRARKAADLFGARAGAKLANALGGVHIQDYNIALEDSVGATDRAADASLTLADKVTLAFRSMTGTVVGFFGENGQIITAIASMSTLLGPTLTKVGAAMGALVGAAMGPEIVAKLQLATAAGGILSVGSLATAGILLAIPATIILATTLVDADALEKQGGYAGGGGIPVAVAPYVTEDDKRRLRESLAAAFGGGGTSSHPRGLSPFEAFFGKGGVVAPPDRLAETLATAYARWLDKVSALARQKHMAQAGEDGVASAKATLAGWYSVLESTDLKERIARWSFEVSDVVTASFKTIPAKTKDGLDRTVIVVRHALHEMRQEAKLRMREIQHLLANPDDRHNMEKELRQQITDGTKAMKKALRTGNESAYAAARDFVNDTRTKLRTLTDEDWSIHVSFVLDRLKAAKYSTADVPGSDAWLKAHGYMAGGGRARAGQSYVVGEYRPEVFVPDTAGTILPSVGSGMSSRVDFYVHDVGGGLARAGISTRALADQMRRWEDGY